MVRIMDPNFEELIKKVLQGKIKASPDKHSAKTPSCLSYSRFKGLVEEYVELSPDEEKHLESCSYCQMVLGLFRKHMAVDIGFDSIESAKDLAIKILQEVATDEDLDEFEEAWGYFFGNTFNWESGEYRDKELFPEILERKVAFVPSLGEESPIKSCIRLFAETRSWIIQSQVHRIQTRLDDLKNHLTKKEFKKEFIESFFSIIKRH